MRVVCTTVMRNEGPFILEWLAYHKLIGVTDFLVYSNDCEDGTDAMLERLQEMGLLTHFDNPRSAQKTVQWKALNRAQNHQLVKKADWIMVSDVDEFLCIHPGEGRIQDLLDAKPEAVGFAIDWRMFGSNGLIQFKDAPVMRQFTRAAPDVMLWPWRAVQFKSLYQADPARYEQLGVHRPDLTRPEAGWAGWFTSAGDPISGQAPGTVSFTTKPRYQLAQFNHYALGSVHDFLVKAARGKPNHTTDPIDLSYWVDRNYNIVEDTAILRYADAVDEIVAEWRKDPELDRLHTASVQWRVAKISQLINESDPFYMMARILQAPDSVVRPLEQQQQLLMRLFKIRQEASKKKKAKKARANKNKEAKKQEKTEKKEPGKPEWEKKTKA